MSAPIIIGVDHGYAAMKTTHFSFHTGLVAHEHEPYTLNNVLEYGGKYYVVGSGRQPLQKDKTQTEDYYLLTLAAVAKELAYRNAGTAADIPRSASQWHIFGLHPHGSPFTSPKIPASAS